MKLIQDFSKFLEKSNESTIQEVLLLRRTSREHLEALDEDLERFCARSDVDSFLLDKTEDNLIDILNDLKKRILYREDSINQLQYDLDDTEVRKSALISTELKTLVDKLIAIGHQLPDDIQRFVENEAFEINKDVIKTRVEHAQFVAELKIIHVQLEFELIEKWEATRRKWRQLRHEQALNGFRTDIHSEDYNHPNDRKQFMEAFRRGQMTRLQVIHGILKEFQGLHYSTMTIDQITEFQTRLTAANEQELSAVQECYNGLTNLRSTADYLAKERAEALRKELHIYGALKISPKLQITAKKLEATLTNETFNELFRLGGGLKQDFQMLVQEMTCDEIVYNRVILSMKEKCEFINCSFSLKANLEEKGRLIQLEKIRSMITKLRNSPRAEIPALLKSLTPELEEVGKMEKTPKLFADSLNVILKEIEEEFIALDKRIAQQSKMNSNHNNTLTGTAGGTKLLSTTAGGNTSTTVKPLTAGLGKESTSSKAGSTTADKNSRNSLSRSKKVSTAPGTAGAHTGLMGNTSVVEIMTYVDPILLKAWHRRLAILFYGSDLPQETQDLLHEIESQVAVQYECNQLVDDVIATESHDQIRCMDLRYGTVIDKICLFLEQQTNYLFTQFMNISNFYSQLSAFLEKHRADQKTLDNKSADELWDLSEDFRFQLEDLESEYEKFCQKIRESTKQEEINENFESVLTVLNKIQDTYRLYHKTACFTADRYPVYLINEFRNCLMSNAVQFFMHPKSSHHIFQQYHRIFDVTERLNATFFEEDPNVLGFPRISDEELFGQNPHYSEEVFVSSNGENEEDYEAVGAFSGGFRLLIEFTSILTKFNEDSFFKFTHPSQAAQQQQQQQPENEETDANKKPTHSVGFAPHPKYPFLKEETTIVPKTPEEIEQLLPEDREEYEKLLIKYFLPIQDYQTRFVDKPEELQSYETMKSYVQQLKEKQEQETSFEYVRSHLPLDAQEHPWIQLVEVTPQQLTTLFTSIRENIISQLEWESCKKILSVEHDMSNKKTEFTNQLEDRIRNHWPRRGRVETEIKQPRENELLSHKDKTYRIVMNFQNKLMEIQSKFFAVVHSNENECENYHKELSSLMGLVHNQYKNLATLQGIDVKARQVTLDFQSENVKRLQALQKILTTDVINQMNTVRDFRKICPLQQKGVEGGYSEQELQEIEVLIQKQLAEISELKDVEWVKDIQSLQELQSNTLKIYDEFQLKYAKCVQEVAMAEGLGQKYGAPRRRAQERIRTELGLDEKRNNKVTEFLSQIEFLSAEIFVHENGENPNILFEESVFSSGSAVSPPPAMTKGMKNSDTLGMTNNKTVRFNETQQQQSKSILLVSQGIDNLKNLHLLWNLLKVLKDLSMKRVNFLNVIGENGFPLTIENLVWINEMRFYELNELIAPSANSPRGGGAGNTSPRTQITNATNSGSTAVVLHAENFLEQMKEIAENVVNNSKIVEAIPTEKEPPKPAAAKGSTTTANNVTGGGVLTLEIVYEEINQNCRKETKQLYESEGLSSILNPKTGIPESLEVWLTEARAKIFGDKGYREKAWKRLWAQIEKLDLLLIRNRNLSQDNNDQHQNRPSSPGNESSASPIVKNKSSKTHGIESSMALSEESTTAPVRTVSIQSAIFFYYTKSMILFSQNDYQMKYSELEKLLKIWEIAKDKNERLLRPKLASPDRQDELNDLNNLELHRSKELTTTTIQFRNFMIRKQIQRFRFFVDDLISLSKGLIGYVDSIIRLELLALPPDTEIPKKHMTLKKLRKAQRLREEIAKGGTDRSKKRKWPAIDLEEICALIKANEDLVTDLGNDPSDFTGGPTSAGGGADNQPASPRATGGGDKKAPAPSKKASDKGSAAVNQAAAVASQSPSLVPTVWMEKMKELSVIEGLVSSAQRVVIEERLLSIQRYQEFLKYFFGFMREEFTKILKQEESWNERWRRQVEMLRQGGATAAAASANPETK
jgi:hypothetical protein